MTFWRHFAVFLPILLVSASAHAQPQPQRPADPVPADVQQLDSLSPLERDKRLFNDYIVRVPLPKGGCFTAQYPNRAWQEVPCVIPPNQPYPHATGTARPRTVGAGTDFFAQVTSGLISSATGSFDSVTGVTAEFGSRNGNLAVLYPDTYTLQLNTNTFANPPACAGDANCFGWQQFIFTNSDCNPSPTACVFMQYWLINKNSPCPAGGWTYYPGSPTTSKGCFRNSNGAVIAAQPIANLGGLRLRGTATPGGQDSVLMTTPGGTISAVGQDTVVNLANFWSGAEFNLVGDCCDSEAFFNAGSSMTVRLAVNNGTTNAPTCATSFAGATAERNNLTLVNCSVVSGASPAIVFTQSGGGSLPPGSSIGDTHLTTVRGAHYDLQATGEFVLVESDTGFVVQARQKAWNPPSVSVNSAVATQMDGTRVAICVSGLFVDGQKTQINDGASIKMPSGVTISRRGSAYTVIRASGDILHSEIRGNYIDLSVVLGATNPYKVRGLLGGVQNADSFDLAFRDGTPLRQPFTYDDFRRFADSWRLTAADSILCEGAVEAGMPASPIYSSDLPGAELERVQSICRRAGVKPGPLLDDCMLDVSLLGTSSAADTFVFTPEPARVIKPGP